MRGEGQSRSRGEAWPSGVIPIRERGLHPASLGKSPKGPTQNSGLIRSALSACGWTVSEARGRKASGEAVAVIRGRWPWPARNAAPTPTSSSRDLWGLAEGQRGGAQDPSRACRASPPHLWPLEKDVRPPGAHSPQTPSQALASNMLARSSPQSLGCASAHGSAWQGPASDKAAPRYRGQRHTERLSRWLLGPRFPVHVPLKCGNRGPL